MQFLYTDLIAVILDKKASTIIFYVTIILTIIQNFNIKKMDIPIINVSTVNGKFLSKELSKYKTCCI